MAGKKNQRNIKSKKTVSDDNVYEVETILDKRIHNRQVFEIKIILIREIQLSQRF